MSTIESVLQEHAFSAARGLRQAGQRPDGGVSGAVRRGGAITRASGTAGARARDLHKPFSKVLDQSKRRSSSGSTTAS